MKPEFPIFGTEYAFVVTPDSLYLFTSEEYKTFVWREDFKVTFVPFTLVDAIITRNVDETSRYLEEK